MVDWSAVCERTLNGGITIDISTGCEPTTGIAYSGLRTAERRVPRYALTPATVERYVRDWRIPLSKAGAHLGTWASDDWVYLDVSHVGERSVDTIERAQQALQLAVWDLDADCEIRVGEWIGDLYVPLNRVELPVLAAA